MQRAQVIRTSGAAPGTTPSPRDQPPLQEWPLEHAPIVLVDDDVDVLAATARFLRMSGYPVQAFDDPRAALRAVVEESPALLVVDLVMPELDGLELARRAVEEDPDLEVIVMTGRGGEAAAARSLRLGACDYLPKPFELAQLGDAVRRALLRRAASEYQQRSAEGLRRTVAERTEALERRTRQVEEVSLNALGALVRTLEAKHPHLRGHGERVSLASASMARHLGLADEDVRDVRVAGLLHDIGMVATPDQVLSSPGELTEAEYEAVKRHVAIGAEILRPLEHLGRAPEYVRFHHERWNGSGYLEGLTGDRIPLGAQIVGVVDSYASMVEERPFRGACPPHEAVETLQASSGVWFQPRLLDALEAVVAGSRGAPALRS